MNLKCLWAKEIILIRIIRIKRKKEVQRFKISHRNIVKHIRASNVTRQIKTPKKMSNILRLIKGVIVNNSLHVYCKEK